MCKRYIYKEVGNAVQSLTILTGKNYRNNSIHKD